MGLMVDAWVMQLILMVTDGRMTDMLTNLIVNLRALRMEHYLVLASDAWVRVRVRVRVRSLLPGLLGLGP